MLREILQVGKHHNQVVSVLFAYLFKQIDKYEYRKAMPSREIAKEVWERVRDNGYVMRDCKLYAYAFHKNSKAGIPTSPAMYGVARADVACLRKLNLSHVPASYPALTLEQFSAIEGDFLTSTQTDEYIGKFISKVLRFLIKSYGVKREDLKNEMQINAMYAMRKQYPYFKSELHMRNTAKTSIHNTGVAACEYWTRAKRNALLKENGGFQAVHVQLDHVEDVGTVSTHDDERFQNMQALVDAARKLGPRAKSFVHAAAGLYDEGFTLFLGIDNSDAANDWDYQRYMGKVRDYHRVTDTQEQRLMQHLRKRVMCEA